MNPRRLALVAAVACLYVLPAAAQISDYEVKRNFEQRYKTIEGQIDSATTLAQLDSLKTQISALEVQYADRAAFLDKALFPQSFDGMMQDLHTRHVLTYDKVYLIQTQGIRITELEGKMLVVTSRLDSLTADRDRLFNELAEAKKSNASLRDAVRRLEQNIQAKDRLIFALVDSIFMPYEKNMNQVSDIQKEAIGRRLEKAEVVRRVHDIASENIRFLQVTSLQSKDYASLIDQYQQFKTKWSGLRDKIDAIYAVQPLTTTAARRKAGKTEETEAPAKPGAGVDTALMQWHAQLANSLWSAIGREFSEKNIALRPFNSGPEFSASIRAYVDSLKASGADPSVFVDDVWKNRIDKEWRDALIKEEMLGRAEYASLDRQVSDLSREKFDLKFILYAVIVVVIVVAAWWFLIRRPKAKIEPPAAV